MSAGVCDDQRRAGLKAGQRAGPGRMVKRYNDMTLHIELDLDPTVNFAMQQNDVPVVKALRLSNEGRR